MTPCFDLSDLRVYLQQASPLIYPNAIRKWQYPQQTLSAVLHDFWHDLFEAIPAAEWKKQTEQNYLGSCEDLSALMLILWLLKAPALKKHIDQTKCEIFLLQAYPAFIKLVPVELVLFEAERQEELIRFCLRYFGWGVQAESEADAEERWQQISTQVEHELILALQAHRKRQAAIKQAQLRRQQQW